MNNTHASGNFKEFMAKMSLIYTVITPENKDSETDSGVSEAFRKYMDTRYPNASVRLIGAECNNVPSL